MLKSALALFALPAILAGCLGGGPPAVDALPTGQIDGAVVDHLLHPFGDQAVHLVQLDRTDRTSPLGGFTFRTVPPGVYTLRTQFADGATAAQVVDVEAGKVTRVILQVMPLPVDLVTFEAFPFQSPGETAEAGAACGSCEWAVPLGERKPREVTFEAVWEVGPLLGKDTDHLDIAITDGLGFPLYQRSDVASPLEVSIDGADIRAEATELRVHVTFGEEFLRRPQPFTMSSVLTNYYGGTKTDFLT